MFAYAVARVVDRQAVEETAAGLRHRHPGLVFETWRDRNRTLLTALEIERTVTSVILFFIVLAVPPWA